MRVTQERCRRILRDPGPIAKVWEKQFDGFERELKRLGRARWNQIQEGDLWYYLHDLAYVRLQPDLFRHLFPACLWFWYSTLMRSESAEQGDADLHHSLHRGRTLDKMLSPAERKAVYELLRDGFLDRIEAERGFVYRGSRTPAYGWIYRFSSLGYVAPVIGEIWDSWWSLDHPGKAVSAIMWASGLVYLKGQNPIFLPWTPEGGGGGPDLTESDSQIYDAPWLPENVAFLKERLSVAYVQDRLDAAAEALSGQPEEVVARRVASDVPSCADVIAIRIGDLVERLSEPNPGFWEC